MRIALLTEGGYPFARGESAAWCDQLLRGLDGHEFEVYALSRSARQERADRHALPGNVRGMRTAALWGPPPGALARGSGGQGHGHGHGSGSGHGYGRRDRRRFADCFGLLASAVCGAAPEGRSDGVPRGRSCGASGGQPDGVRGELADRFAEGLHGLADLALTRGGLPAALRSELALRVLESACHAPGALRAAHSARVADLVAVTTRLERALRPLSLDWYGSEGRAPRVAATRAAGEGRVRGLAAADLCHVVGGGPAALPGLVARRLFGTPLLITEYAVRLREHFLASAADAVAPVAAGAPVRALLASFQRLLAQEAYEQAELITPGDAQARRWQERCGARRERLRTVPPGLDAVPFAAVGEAGESGECARERGTGAPTLVWAGRAGTAQDLSCLLRAFVLVREAVPRAGLRIVSTASVGDTESAGSLQRCRELAARLFPPGEQCPGGKQTRGASDGRACAGSVHESPVSFEEPGAAGAGTLADAYAAGQVVVDSGASEGFPVSLVAAMFCASATVSTDVGAVREVIGGTGLVVPPGDPRALADGCVALLTDPARAARLGAAARARALELFTAERNIAAFRALYLELMSHGRKGGERFEGEVGEGGPDRGAQPPLPFARPAESHVPGRWAAGARGRSTAAVAGGRRPAARAGAGEPPAAARHLAVPGRDVPSWARPGLPEPPPTAAAGRRARKPERGEAR